MIGSVYWMSSSAKNGGAMDHSAENGSTENGNAISGSTENSSNTNGSTTNGSTTNGSVANGHSNGYHNVAFTKSEDDVQKVSLDLGTDDTDDQVPKK